MCINFIHERENFPKFGIYYYVWLSLIQLDYMNYLISKSKEWRGAWSGQFPQKETLI